MRNGDQRRRITAPAVKGVKSEAKTARLPFVSPSPHLWVAKDADEMAIPQARPLAEWLVMRCRTVYSPVYAGIPYRSLMHYRSHPMPTRNASTDKAAHLGLEVNLRPPPPRREARD